MLLIRLTKKQDGGGVLRCVRADGSATWQAQKNRHAGFFALHDLTHFAVESALGYRRGFYGLIAEGWDVEDTTGKGVRGPLPEEAGEVEHLVGLFDRERSGGVIWTAEEFNEFAWGQASSPHPEPRRLTEADLSRVRALRGKLFSEWSALAPGGTIELSFES